MGDAFRMFGSLRSALSARRDLLLEHLALHHIAGGAKGFDSGPVALDQEGLASPQKFVPSFGAWRPTTASGARRGSTGSC
jgi:hypothetical protein